MNKLWLLGLIALGVIVLLLADRCGSTIAWEKKLATAVAVAEARRTADSARYAIDRNRIVADSSRADSSSRAASNAVAIAERDRVAAGVLAHGARIATAAAEAALAAARDLPDTARRQAELIVSQRIEIRRLDGVITADTATIHSLVRDTLAFAERLGVSNRGTEIERTRAISAEKARDDLIAAASHPPRGVHLLGFTVALKPYVGVGLNYALVDRKDSAGKSEGRWSPGAQIGISIARMP